MSICLTAGKQSALKLIAKEVLSVLGLGLESPGVLGGFLANRERQILAKRNENIIFLLPII